MKLIISIILSITHLYVNELISQTINVNYKCSGNIIDTTIFFNKYPFQKYSDFKKKYIGDDLKYYIDDNKKKLAKFNDQISIDNYNQFHYNQFSVQIFAIDTVIRLDNYYEYKEIYENPIVNKLNIKDYYGNVDLGETTAIKIIDSIYIIQNSDTLRVPKKYFEDLMNPNLTNNFKGYKPSEAYYNKTKDYIAIYITGKIDEFYFDAMGSVGSSYVAKIIYDRKKKNFARIIVPATYLFSYGWIRCENFWPF